MVERHEVSDLILPKSLGERIRDGYAILPVQVPHASRGSAAAQAG